MPFKYSIQNDNKSNCEMDLTTWIIVIILVLSLIYYLMNMFGKKKNPDGTPVKNNSKMNWLVIIALLVSAIYLIST